MSIHRRHWKSTEREVVVCRYTVETGHQPNGRLFYVNTQKTLEISRMRGCCMSIHSRHWRAAEREVVVCQYTGETGDQTSGRMLYVNTQ